MDNDPEHGVKVVEGEQSQCCGVAIKKLCSQFKMFSFEFKESLRKISKKKQFLIILELKQNNRDTKTDLKPEKFYKC